MSGLQLDLYTNYIGGEIRLAYYHEGNTAVPITGISISGKLDEVLSSIRLSRNTAVYGSYSGPEKAILHNLTIF
jgi:PmbA protein